MFVRGGIFVGWNTIFTLCGLTLRSVFVFSRHPGARVPGDAVVKSTGEGVVRNYPVICCKLCKNFEKLE